MEIKKKANAKINLSLDLTGVLPNGYHAIHTVMQSVTLHDTVTVSDETPGIRLKCTDPAVPTDRRNTAVKAAELFFEACGLPPRAEIGITKRIPSQAGLAGGSADAAAALLALNEMYRFPLNTPQLLKIALKIGADVPFALTGGLKLCLNIGEIMADLPQFHCFVLIAKPERGVSTAEAFRKYDGGAPLRHPDNDKLLYYFAAGQPRPALESACNVFAQLTELPETNRTNRAMLENGAFYASLSGSGSACFGLFDDREKALRTKNALEGTLPFLAICETAPAGVQDAE